MDTTTSTENHYAHLQLRPGMSPEDIASVYAELSTLFPHADAKTPLPSKQLPQELYDVAFAFATNSMVPTQLRADIGTRLVGFYYVLEVLDQLFQIAESAQIDCATRTYALKCIYHIMNGNLNRHHPDRTPHGSYIRFVDLLRSTAEEVDATAHIIYGDLFISMCQKHALNATRASEIQTVARKMSEGLPKGGAPASRGVLKR